METTRRRLRLRSTSAMLQIDASPETVWEFLVDPEKVARWKGLPATAFDPQPGGAYRIEIVPGHVASGAFVELRAAAPARLHLGLGAGRGRARTWCRPARRRSRSSWSPRTAARGCGSPIATCPSVEAAQSHGEGWDHYLERLVDRSAGRRPGARPVARRARLIERRAGACVNQRRREHDDGEVRATPTRAAGCPRAKRKASGSWRPGRPGSAASAIRSWTSATRSAPPPRSAAGRRRESPATRS